MGEVSTIGLDIAKSVFQVHGIDDAGVVVMRKRVGRAKVLKFFAGLSPCLVGIEACPSAHYWSRQLQALGHSVKLMPPSYVKAYLKRSKNDANDAAAICEAVTRPSMRFVPIKTQEQQTGLMLHRTRQCWSGNARCCRTRSAGIWPSLASSRPRAAMVRPSCCRLSVMWRTIESRQLPGFVLSFLLANT
jgi:transposase